MNIDIHVADHVFARGFILSEHSASELEGLLWGKPYATNLDKWHKTFFGPCTLWTDPLLNYARTRDARFGVGIMGLCINPFDGLSDNQKIADALYQALAQNRSAFFDYVDQLSGSFIIIYRENADVFLLQDTAATKPIYYHRTSGGRLTATSHAAILHQIYGLPPDTRAQTVYASDTYREDPSRYLPGMITPYEKALPLTANNQLEVKSGTSQRFFPREELAPRPFNDRIVDEIAEIMVQQACMIGALERPLTLAATGGRDSRVSAAAFSGQPNLSYHSFHIPRTGHLTEDVNLARKLAQIEGVPLDVYDLQAYPITEFQKPFKVHSPRGIWPAAALCYLIEFPRDAIHIRSSVAEIGRAFYKKRREKFVSDRELAKSFTNTAFGADPMVIATMKDFIKHTNFDEKLFFNYSFYDMFYWEHRLSKWQNVLCSEAEIATDVFIPFNNRNLMKMFLSVPYENRVSIDIHHALCKKLKPEFSNVPFF